VRCRGFRDERGSCYGFHVVPGEFRFGSALRGKPGVRKPGAPRIQDLELSSLEKSQQVNTAGFSL